MSASVWFLAIAVVVSLVGIAVVAWRHRQPQSFDSSIHDFSRRMSTLAPEGEEPPDSTGRVYPRRPGDDVVDGVDPTGAADEDDAPTDPVGADADAVDVVDVVEVGGDDEPTDPVGADADAADAVDVVEVAGDDEPTDPVGADADAPVDLDPAPAEGDDVAFESTAAPGPEVTDGS